MLFQKRKKIITHSGHFHSDEVFSVAALSILLNDRVQVVRTRDPKLFETGDFVLDIGLQYDAVKNRFDHHQEGGAGKRENGAPYSSFGLVWKHYGEEIAGSKEVADMVDKNLVTPVDIGDNGVGVYHPIADDIYAYKLSDIINSFNATWQEINKVQDKAFAEAVQLAKKILIREITQERAKIDAREKVVEAYKKTEDKRVIVLSGYLPWGDVIREYPEPLFVVLPDMQNGGNWRLCAIKKEKGSFENRKDLPAAWAGKQGEEFVEITGVPDAVFCHNKRFIAGAGSREGALLLASLAVKD